MYFRPCDGVGEDGHSSGEVQDDRTLVIGCLASLCKGRQECEDGGDVGAVKEGPGGSDNPGTTTDGGGRRLES